VDDLAPEAREYLRKSGATQATPIERLAHMNQPSIDLYRQLGLDLHDEPLEVGVCAQHCNGGFAVDEWWESSVPHLFVIGELAGTHGVKRPGGSALNSGQVGGLRAAQRIAHVYHADTPDADFSALAQPLVRRMADLAASVKTPGERAFCAAGIRGTIQKRMSRYAGMVRSLNGLQKALEQARVQRDQMARRGMHQQEPGWTEAAEARELAVAQEAFLCAMRELLARGGGSRGSHLVTHPDGELPHPDLGDEWRYLRENVDLREQILSVSYNAGTDEFRVQAVRPRTAEERTYWFETTWNEFRQAEIYRTDDDEDARPYEV
jgi:succinate dehydrogenase/fumarate reductase flavoprotein subunit